MISFTSIENLLKKVIAPRVEAQYAKGTVLLDALPTNKAIKDPMNQYFYITLKYNRNPSITPLSSTFALPAAGAPKYAQARVDCKYIVGRFQIPDPILDSARGNAQSLVNVLTEYSDDLMEAMKKDTNRMLYGNGSGTLALAASGNVTTATTALTVNTPGSDYLYEGLPITINGQNSTVSTIDSAIKVTLTSAVTWPAAAPITKRETADWMGLRGIISTTGTVQNIIKDTNFWWQSFVEATGEALSLTRMQEAYRAVEKYGSTKLIVTSFATRDRYCDLLTSYKQIQPATQNVWGYKGPEFNGIAVIGDQDCLDGDMYFLDTDALSREQLVPMGWMDREGHILKAVSGFAGYEAILKNYGNLCSNNCRKLSRLSGKT